MLSLSLLGQIHSLVGEPRSHKPCDVAKEKGECYERSPQSILEGLHHPQKKSVSFIHHPKVPHFSPALHTMCVCTKSLQLCLTLCNSMAPLSMGFPRQEYWSGLPFPSPGHLPDPGIEPVSPALAGGFFTTSTTWEASLQP